MKQETFAPWAEPVPGAPYPMTADDVLALPDDGWFYELVEGRLVRMPMSGGEASRIAVRLVVALSVFAEPRHLGAVLGAITGALWLCGFVFWQAVDPDDPGKVLAVEVMSVQKAWWRKTRDRFRRRDEVSLRPSSSQRSDAD